MFIVRCSVFAVRAWTDEVQRSPTYKKTPRRQTFVYYKGSLSPSLFIRSPHLLHLYNLPHTFLTSRPPSLHPHTSSTSTTSPCSSTFLRHNSSTSLTITVPPPHIFNLLHSCSTSHSLPLPPPRPLNLSLYFFYLFLNSSSSNSPSLPQPSPYIPLPPPYFFYLPHTSKTSPVLLLLPHAS